jgi:hypothetical protein
METSARIDRRSKVLCDGFREDGSVLESGLEAEHRCLNRYRGVQEATSPIHRADRITGALLIADDRSDFRVLVLDVQ